MTPPTNTETVEIKRYPQELFFDECLGCGHKNNLDFVQEKLREVANSARLEERERIMDFIKSMKSNYPKEIFLDLDKKDLERLADFSLKVLGFSIDRISAYYARWQEKLVKEDIIKAINPRE